MFSFESRVRYSETDEEGKLSLSALMNYLQDCSTFQSESLGVGVAYLQNCHRAWLLSSWQIVIDRYPKLCEKIRIGTHPYDFTGGLGWRNFMILDEQGDYLVKANSVWLYLDTESGRPVRPDEKEMALYGSEERLPMEYAPRKLVMPKDLCEKEPIPVRPHHLDTNHHVNNVQYVEIARELLPADLVVRELRVEYRSQARLGDVLYPGVGYRDGWYYVGLNNEKGRCYAAVALRAEQAAVNRHI